MADVRVQTSQPSHQDGPNYWDDGNGLRVHPDDLARAIREGAIPVVDERIRAILRGTLTALDRVIAAPREPAQERRPTIEELEAILASPDEGHKIDILPDGSIRAAREQAQERQEAPWWRFHPEGKADTLRWIDRATRELDALHKSTPPAAPDPLLPGLRAARQRMTKAAARVDDYVKAWDAVRDWLDAEIARREGGA